MGEPPHDRPSSSPSREVPSESPTLTIGMPVFNGADYIGSAVGSILSQSFADFELIISDNASTDDTQAIAASLAARDPRVRYRRNAENLGISANFNLLVPMARGRYFKWATADDLLRPGYLARCLEALDADPTVVLAYTQTDFIDADGNRLDLVDPGWQLMTDDRSERLRFAITADHFVNAVLGVMVTSSLRGTRLSANYPGGDYRLMAELSLLGKFIEVPEPLYVRRIHPSSTKGNTGNTSWLRGYFGGARPRGRAAYWRLSGDRAVIVLKADIPVTRKLALLGQLARTMITNRRQLVAGLLELLGRDRS